MSPNPLVRIEVLHGNDWIPLKRYTRLEEAGEVPPIGLDTPLRAKPHPLMAEWAQQNPDLARGDRRAAAESLARFLEARGVTIDRSDCPESSTSPGPPPHPPRRQRRRRRQRR